jgi:beta-glucosidase/6-phospho-beta-glucosidase/beta-galactosidase
MGGDKPGVSCDFWNHFEGDIARAHSMGLDSFRFSLEWHRIEPQRGQIDREAVARYHQMLDVMEKYKMVPLATLHHFVHPQWFEDLGGFEKEANIEHFLSWTELAYRSFGARVRNWCTFNEPGVFAFSGYFFGSFPPGKFFATRIAGRVVKHMLIAHSRAYDLIKRLPGGAESEVGLVHNEMRFEWYRGDGITRWAPHARILLPIFDTCWGNDAITDYMRTGRFVWRPTGPWRPVSYINPGGPPPLDYVGLNYYSRMVIDWKCQVVGYPGEVMTDMDYSIYPAGFYTALMRAANIGKPVIVTETGIPDGADSRREMWATSYLKALEEAVADGADVRGLLYWTLTDNFEWAFGFKSQFGLFEWTPGMAPGQREARPSTKLIRRLFKALPGRVAKLRAGGLAALRELQHTDDVAAEAEADAKADLENEDESAHLLGRTPLSSTPAGAVA